MEFGGEKNFIEEVVHDQKVKYKYRKLEREIKRVLTEFFMLTNLGSKNEICRGLSITKDFLIRVLSEEENSKFLSNPATIKNPTLKYTTESVKEYLYNLINDTFENEREKIGRKLKDQEKLKKAIDRSEEIEKKYKFGINQFLDDLKNNPINNQYLNDFNSSSTNKIKFLKYLLQANYLVQVNGDNAIGERNVRRQVAKILFNKFGESAFTVEKDGKIVLSDKSLNYIRTIFKIGVDVLRSPSRGLDIDQIYHDGDWCFIKGNKKADEDEYIRAIVYLLNPDKINYYGKRGNIGKQQRLEKRLKFANILRALTNDQLRIHEFTDEELLECNSFHWDNVTKNLLRNGEQLLRNVVEGYEGNNLSKKLKSISSCVEKIIDLFRNGKLKDEVEGCKGNNRKIKISKRLKSISSCVEKIIEGKYINDQVGLRLSMNGIDNQCFDIIEKISKEWFEKLEKDLKKNPSKYVSKGQTISIKKISVDNKGVLNSEQIENIVNKLNSKGQTIPIKKIPVDNKGILNSVQIENIDNELKANVRKKPNSPYIEIGEWKKRMKKCHKNIYDNKEKQKILEAFYNLISGTVARGSNGSYKDFKFNIIFEIKDKHGNSIGERTMEVQFDDISNGIGLSNYNIRNFERIVNTLSRLSFSTPLSKIRKIGEEHLKYYLDWAKDWAKELPEEQRDKIFKIPFPIKNNGQKIIDISDFEERNEENKETMDKAIVNTINYFLKKGTFIFYYDPDLKDEKKDEKKEKKEEKKEKKEGKKKKNKIKKKGLLKVSDLKSPFIMENLQICSFQELASLQHSYLQNKRNHQVGIYVEDEDENGNARDKIYWISLGELIDSMNLGKKKIPEYSVEI